jgi:DNA-binding transcriptional regulator YhcF (GntR family)
MKFEKGTFGLFPALILKGMCPYQQIVFAWLCFHSDKNGYSFPSVKTLCNETGISKTCLLKSLKELEKNSYIKITKRKHHDTNSYSSNAYLINSKKVVRQTHYLVRQTDQGSTPDGLGVVRQTVTNQTHIEPKPNNQRFFCDFYSESEAFNLAKKSKQKDFDEMEKTDANIVVSKTREVVKEIFNPVHNYSEPAARNVWNKQYRHEIEKMISKKKNSKV